MTNKLYARRASNAGVSGFFDSSVYDYVQLSMRQPDFAERYNLFQREIEIASQHLGSQPLCVDLGCGPGTLALGARQRGFKVIGIDASAPMLDYARKVAGQRGLDISFRQAALPLDDKELSGLRGNVDLLIVSSVVEYITDVQKFATQCRVLLAPKGVGLVSFANSRSIYRAAERRLARIAPSAIPYMTVQTHQHDAIRARRLFEGVGLQVVSLQYFGMPSWLYPMWRSSRRPPWLATLFLLTLGVG